MELLAREEGIDVNSASLRSQPWKPASNDDIGEISFLGAVDQLIDLDKHYKFSQHAMSSQGDSPQAEDGRPDAGARVEHISVDTEPNTHIKSEVYEAPSERFKYDSLPFDSKNIRLLRYGPADEQNVVSSIEMHTFDLDTAPSFYALSYVWNSIAKDVPITCNGKRLMITASLAHAFKRSMRWGRGIWLWADGMCINQDDVAERSHQVTLMGEIYTRASKVLAHLPYNQQGDNDSGAWSAISLMNLLNRVWSRDSDYSGKPEEEWERILSTNQNSIDMWKASLHLWMNPWFTRSWILQEGVLGDTVVIFFGNATCSLNAITMFWDLARRRDMPRMLKYGPLADIYMTSRNLSQVSSLKQIRALLHKPSKTGETLESVRHKTKSIRDDDIVRTPEQSKLSLLNLLALSRSNGATDPRDKVYALLALAKDEIAKSIKPDYSIENTVAQVYIEVAQKYIEHGRGPELLHHAGGSHLVADLPTWVPDWSLQTRSAFRKSLYKCSGYSQPHITLGPDPAKIQIRGAIIDSIANVGFPCRYYTYDVSQDKLLPMLEEQSNSLPAVNTDHHMRQVVYATGKMFCENLCSSSRYAEPMGLVLGRTLAADCTRSGKRSDQAFLESWAAY